jgi:predicted MFS family arabinose efflux permease
MSQEKLVTHQTPRKFTSYEVFIIAILSFTQFTIILDFMVLSPLGAILMPKLQITASQFAAVVSAYAFSAGVSGLLAAGFADKYDRKKLLLFFYIGFILGTALCAMAPTYQFLLMARVVTGIFGGVIGSIGFAIVTDLFKMEVRGTVMGFMQMSFASSQILGLPLGLYLANKWGWHSPFALIVVISIIAVVLIMVYMKPVDAHLKLQSERNAVQHLIHTVSNRSYIKGFAATVLLATGGFMLMPFASAFSVNNLGITLEQLPLLYMITGVFSMITGPFVGKLSDRVGKYNVFVGGSLLTIAVVIVYCNLGITPFYLVVLSSVLMFAGVSSRMISSSALLSAVPEPADRGAFMGINASIQQIAGGIATTIAGMIVYQDASQKMQNYDILGYVVSGASLITIAMMYIIHRHVMQKLKTAPAGAPKPQPAEVGEAV